MCRRRPPRRTTWRPVRRREPHPAGRARTSPVGRGPALWRSAATRKRGGGTSGSPPPPLPPPAAPPPPTTASLLRTHAPRPRRTAGAAAVNPARFTRRALGSCDRDAPTAARGGGRAAFAGCVSAYTAAAAPTHAVVGAPGGVRRPPSARRRLWVRPGAGWPSGRGVLLGLPPQRCAALSGETAGWELKGVGERGSAGGWQAGATHPADAAQAAFPPSLPAPPPPLLPRRTRAGVC